MTRPLPVTPIRFWAALWLLIFGTLASLSCRDRLGRRRVLCVRSCCRPALGGHRDVHRLAFEQWRPLRHSVLLDPVHELRDEVPPELRVGQLAAPEADGHL